MKLFVLFLVFIGHSNSWEIFHKDRLRHFNLQPPKHVKLPQSLKEAYVTQRLDHFNFQETTLWKQRYFVNEQYFVKGKQNVAYLMIGGEGSASVLWMDWGAWMLTAKQHNALLFQLEHRFYGRSKPTENYSTANLKFLNSEQALADLANFITEMNKLYELGENVKWIAFGGSYAGNLAAWLRQKYPHLVIGAVSSSGPVLAQLDFSDYYKIVKDDLLVKGGKACVDAVQASTDQLKVMLSSPEVSQLDQMFKLCSPISKSLNNSLDISSLFEYFAIDYALIAQYNDDQDIFNNLKLICETMTDKSIGTELQRLATFHNQQLSQQKRSCTNYLYDNIIQYYKEFETEQGGGRQWLYQTCTEFGYFQTSNSKPQIFGDQFPSNYSIQICKDIFGEEYNETFIETGIKETNTHFGGVDIDISNVVFVHGTIDPWHALGVLESKKDATVILINGTAHCTNMYEESWGDPPELNAARNQIDKLINQWLSQ